MNYSDPCEMHPQGVVAALLSSLRTIVAIALIASTLPAAASDPPWAVHAEGRSSDVLATHSIGPHVPLLGYVHREHVYGLGPIAGYRGEVLLWDSVPLLGQVESARAISRTDPSAAAIWLAWAQVLEWRTLTIDRGIRIHELEALLSAEMKSAGVPTGTAVPFRVKGRFVNADMTITNYHDDGSPITAERLSNVDAAFDLHDQDVELFGFYSTGQKGIFMPLKSNVHVHARTVDAVYHVRDLLLEPGALMFLPVR